MTKEDGLTPFSRGLETTAEITWQQFKNRAKELGNRLAGIYDQSPIERKEYEKEVCIGGSNFGKTVNWVVEYSPNPNALESIGSALEAISEWPNAGSMAWEMRRFIKFSSAHGYDNVPEVVKFGDLIKKIGEDNPTNQNNCQIDMDFFYWDAGWGVDGESTNEEIIRGHARNVTSVISELEMHAYPELIDAEPQLTQEEVKAQEKKEAEQYWKDFLADAKSFYQRPSFFDLLDTDELINRPYHKIVTYPAEIADIANGAWINHRYEDPSDAVAHYYRELPYMAVKRADKNWFPSPLPHDYVDFYRAKFERRLKRTLEQKPWLIDFSVRWQDVLQRSFIGGNHQTNHAGEVELVYKDSKNNPAKGLFRSDYEWRRLETEEERLFFESVANIQSLEDSQPPVKPPHQTWVFNGQTGRPYLFTLSDGRDFNIFLKHEYGSLHWEGKVVIATNNGPEPLFQ